MKTYTIKGFKQYITGNSSITLDFRRHVYLNNCYGLTPCFEYADAIIIIKLLDKYTKSAIIYNLDMSCNQLRMQKLKDFINEWLDIANRQS